jgi:tripartite-type tricarboxylate transporter receptor subunit TctC
MEISRRALVGGALATVVMSSRAHSSPAEFYRGNKIRLLVGTTPGAGYDLIARLLAAHLGKHVPGNPSVVVENMPGAGSLTWSTISTITALATATMGLPLNGILLGHAEALSRTGGR